MLSIYPGLILFLTLTLTVRCQHDNEDSEIQDEKHIQEHLQTDESLSEESKDQFHDDTEAVKEGDDTKGIFHFFNLHDLDKNNKLDGLELYVAFTDYHEKNNDDDLSEKEIVKIIDDLLQAHDLNEDGYLAFFELMNTSPDSIWNKLGKLYK
ncbi:multiple coagulation factor deficiency protein 2 homolog isoform X2 [Xenia sp. Carnegie-2017]|uniref:multiple coagulation factor deficiency protein 2 homolog isoform X2 n=1 Tax=Xenia sp. Carnegie-2017 TaxID=2897299 RepID=UPI001F04918E|nr:multiple coagulation factor deficiency protein 2 homolog isoform X2 [Xenia sp. Carnegie-2017]